MSRDKRSAAALSDTFFAGVDALRAHLDRKIQDPPHRRARLARLASAVLRHRAPEVLAGWLVREAREALGAVGGALYLVDAAAAPDTPYVADGLLDAAPPPITACGVRQLGASSLWLPLPGTESVLGGLWLTGLLPLDDANLELLEATLGAAGAVLEQRGRLAMLERDPMTELLGELSFLDAAVRAIRRGAAENETAVFALVRLAGGESLRAAQGTQAARRAVRALADAARSVLSPETLLGARFDDVLVLLRGVPVSAIDGTGWRLARDLDARLAQVLAGGACTVVLQAVDAKTNWSALLETAHAAALTGRAGGVVQLR